MGILAAGSVYGDTNEGSPALRRSRFGISLQRLAHTVLDSEAGVPSCLDVKLRRTSTRPWYMLMRLQPEANVTANQLTTSLVPKGIFGSGSV